MSMKKLAALLGLIALVCVATPALSTTVSNVLHGYQGYFQVAVPVAIPSGSPTSAAVTLNGYEPVGIYMPSSFTGATISFTACDTVGGTYETLKSTTSGTTLTYTVTQSTYVALDPKDFYGVNFLKIISASSEAGARTLKVALKGF